MEHTKGPWKVVRPRTSGEPDYLVVPDDDENFKICRISNAITFIMDFDDKAEADARLIAAAPDLYEALEAIVMLEDAPPVEDPDGSSGFGTWLNNQENALRDARAALSRARGDSHE